MQILLNLPDPEYRSAPAISQSELKDYAVSPMHWAEAKRRPRESSPEMEWGTACHLAAFQPELLASSLAIVPKDAPKRPTSVQLNAKKPSPDTLDAIAFWQKFNEEAAGRIVMSKSDADEVAMVGERVRRHPFVYPRWADGGFFGQGKSAEVSAFTPMSGTDIAIKGRFDFVAGDCILDLKTFGKQATPRLFRSRVWESRYDLQNAQYRHIARQPGSTYGLIPDRFVFVVVEKTAPYGIALFELPKEELDETEKEWRGYVTGLAQCKMMDAFPGYPEEVQTLHFRGK